MIWNLAELNNYLIMSKLVDLGASLIMVSASLYPYFSKCGLNSVNAFTSHPLINKKLDPLANLLFFNLLVH